jgi:hypothetical protein
MSWQSRSSRINGLAFFAGATFAIGLATIMVLERVGAPGGLIRAIGPVVVLLAVSIVGIGAHSADLASFIAARRQAPSFYGGLSSVAIASGIALSLYPGLISPFDPPLLGFFAGVALGTIALGPFIRSFGATSPADVVATRFPRSPIRLFSAIVIWTPAALTALAGYRVAVAAAQGLLTSNRGWAEAIVAAVLILTVTPGGLTGVVFCSAASGGVLAMVALVGFVASSHGAPHIYALAPDSLAIGSPMSFGPTIGTMLATASLFAFAPGSIVSPSVGGAMRAGLVALVLGLALASLTDAALSVFPLGPGSSASNLVAASYIGAATLASALALASFALQMSARAFGVALADPPKPFRALASVRLARMRAAQIFVVVACAVYDSKDVLDPRTALIIAMALSLALAMPLVALAAVPRVGPTSAGAAILAALAIATYQASTMKGLPSATNLFEVALLVAAVAFVVGSLTSLVAPRRGQAPTPGAFDPFAGDRANPA